MSTPCERNRMSSPSQLGVLETPHHPEVPLQACFKLRNAWKNLSGYCGENPVTTQKCRSRRGVGHKRLEMDLVTSTIFSHHDFKQRSVMDC